MDEYEVYQKKCETIRQALCETIKWEMPDWLLDCEQYYDPDAINPFGFPF